MNMLLAMLRDGSLAEVKLERTTRQRLSQKFDELAARFLNQETEVHNYVPAFTPEPGAVMKLKFDLPRALLDCRRQLPGDMAELSAQVLSEGAVKALAIIDAGDRPRFSFQAMDSRFLIRPSSIALFFDRVFELNDSAGVVFPERLDAMSIDGDLYFRSE
jgi:hypothetical protein